MIYKRICAALCALILMLTAVGCSDGEGQQSGRNTGVQISIPDFADADSLITSDADVYRITGQHKDGLVVDSEGSTVHIILDGTTITADCPIHIRRAKRAIVTIADGTENRLVCSGDKDADAAIFARCDLIITGGGSLTIESQMKGIRSKDTLEIQGGDIAIDSVGHSLLGKDFVKLRGCNLSAVSESGAIYSSSKSEQGVIYIADGSYSLSAGKDGLHSGRGICISGGEIALDCSDDGIHSDGPVAISGGSVAISQCKEGIEGSMVLISGGSVDITASDDGLNAALSDDDDDADDARCYISVTGGDVRIDAGGDGIDSNGSVYISGGKVSVSGPTDDENGALDYDDTCVVSGGVICISGSSGMARGSGEGSTQPGALVYLSEVMPADTEVLITDKKGDKLASFTPDKEYSSVFISIPQFKKGKKYTVTCGGESLTIKLKEGCVTAGGTQ